MNYDPYCKFLHIKYVRFFFFFLFLFVNLIDRLRTNTVTLRKIMLPLHKSISPLAPSMATSLNTGVPWVMCQQRDAPDSMVTVIKEHRKM